MSTSDGRGLRAVKVESESFGFGWAFLASPGPARWLRLCRSSLAGFFFHILVWVVSIDSLFHVGWKSNDLGRFRSNVD